MRILFAGNPEIAVPSLAALGRRGWLVGLLTNPESAAGRGRAPRPTRTAAAAAAYFPTLPVLAYDHLGPEARAAAASLAPELLVSFAYGRIFGPKFLELFPRGGLNVHPSLLPRHRGTSPIQQAILDRDAETGICVQALAPQMDCGDIFASERIALAGRETASSLSAWAAERGAVLLERVIEDMEAGRAAARPQEGEPSYCGKMGKEDGLLDWSRPTEELDARIRAFDLWPLAYGFLGGQRLGILEAEPAQGLPALPQALPGTILGIDAARGILVRTGNGILALKRLQLAGRKALNFREFANGVRNLAGSSIENRGPGLEKR